MRHPFGSIDILRHRYKNSRKVASLDEEFNILIGVDKQYIQKRIHKIEHRHSHLASAFFASPFKEAALLSIDG